MLLLSLLSVLTVPSAAPFHEARDLPPLTVGTHVFHRRELANGLRAVAVRDEGETVSVFVVLGIGKRQETPETTGLAHLVEHAMFSGTPTVATDRHEGRVKEWGGESNAFTREDYTLYYDDGLPPERLAEVLAMEADRLRNLHFEEAPVLHERSRLELEESRTYQPSEGRAEALEAAVFRVHPYRAGLRDDEGHTRAPRLSIATMRAFYDRYYHPNNACVVVVGPVEPESALFAVEVAFGKLPAGPPLDAPPPEPFVDAPRTERIPSALPRDRYELCWVVPELGAPSRPALGLLARWLGRRELAGGVAVEAASGGRVDRDLFRVAASGEGALEGLRGLVERVRSEPLPAEELAELARLERGAYADLPLRARPYFSLAGSFGVLEVLGHAELAAGYAAAIDSVTVADVLAAAREYLAPERCVTVVFEGTGEPVEPLPEDRAGLATAAREAADAGDVERAVAAYTALLAKRPDRMNTVIYLAERGMLRLDARDYDGAIADFEEALDVVDYPAVRDLLEEAHARKTAALRGEFEGQEEAVQEAVEEEQEEAPESGDEERASEAELLAEVEGAMADLERWRGLRFLAPIVPEFVESGAESASGDEKLGGWYESDTDRLVVVLGKGATFARGAQLHEIFHALQDQTWDLGVLHARASTTDERRALSGLIEGEAMLAVSELMDYDFEQHAVLAATGEIDRARFEKVFQYGTGLRFVRALREAEPGGWAAVNRAWGAPPRSTAELFHPERYPAEAVETLEELPVEEAAEGAERVEADVLGEFELRWLLVAEEGTRGLAEELGSELVADRWGRWVLPGGEDRERWDLRFRSAAAAERFFEEGRAAYEREGWGAEVVGRDVRLVR